MHDVGRYPHKIKEVYEAVDSAIGVQAKPVHCDVLQSKVHKCAVISGSFVCWAGLIPINWNLFWLRGSSFRNAS